MTSWRVRRAYQSCFYPSKAQAAELSRTFGCVRKVYNMALQARTEAWTLRASKAKGSANRAKARTKVARIHARISDRRRNHLHKLTTRLVRENQTLVIEDLTVRDLVKNRKPARAISDATRREFRGMLEYKAEWYRRTLVMVDRWFPSSKLCSACGTLTEAVPLGVRIWTCGGCGAVHDHDVNAATNLLAAGRAVTVCGDGVRPQRKTPGGQSSVKQKPQPARAGIRRH